MNKIIILIKKYYHILFFILLSSWILFYKQAGIISTGDFVFPPQPSTSFYIRLFSWKEWSALGHLSAIDFVNIIYYLPIFLLNKIGVPLVFIQSLFFIFLFFTASYSIYLLLSELLGNFKYKKLVAIISANLYIFNPYIFTMKLQGYNMSLYAYVFAPLILYLFYKYLKTRNYFKNKYLYLIGLCFLLAAPGYTTPSYLTWIIFILFFYILFLFLLKKINRIILYKSLLVILIFILINSFWIIPSLTSGMFSDVLSQVKSATNLDILDSTSGQSLVEVFRFLGMHGFTSTWRGIPYFPYYPIYFTPIFIIISFVLLFTALSFCLFKYRGKQNKKDRFWERYFFSIYLLAIFFIGGTVFLLPGLKQWLFENFPIMLIYRKPYEKLGFFLIFSFVGLFAFSLKSICCWLENKTNKHKNKIIVGFLLFVLLLINIYSFPFWTRQIFSSYSHPESEYKISNIGHYPNYYYKLGEYFQKDRIVGKILGLPVNHSPISSGTENYNWGYAGVDPIYSFVNTGYILLNPLKPFLKDFYGDINSNNITDSTKYKDNLINISNLFNVKKVILRKDICWQLYGSPNPEQDKRYLDDNFEKITSLGKLDIYQIDNKDFSPIFYTPLNVIILNQTVDSLPKIVSQLGDQNRSAIYFNEQNEKIPTAFLNKSNINLIFTKNLAEKSQFIKLGKEYVEDRKYSLMKNLNSDTMVNIKYSGKEQKIILSLADDSLSFNSQFLKDNNIKISEIPAKSNNFIKIGNKIINITDKLDQKVPFSENIELYSFKKHLLADSFEQGLWEKEPNDCTNRMTGEPDLNMQLSSDATDGENSLELGSKNHYACTSKSFPVKLEENKIYKYSFDYKNVKGDKVGYYYNLRGKEKKYPFSESIKVENHDWNHYETFIDPEEDINTIDLFFYAPSNGEKEIVNRFDNIKLEELEFVESYNIETGSLVIQENIKLNERENKIEYIGNPEQINLIMDSSFETGLWQDGVSDCTNRMTGEPDLNMQLSSDATDGENSLELGSKNHYACTSKSFPVKLEENKIYKYSFDYKNVKGDKVGYYYNLRGKEKKYPFSESIKVENHDWNHYETFVDPKEDINSIDLFFYAPSDGKKEIVNRFDNIKLEEWMTKDIFNYYLYSETEEKIQTPILEFKKISPIKYKIVVHQAKDNFPLVFSESFNKGWKAYIGESQVIDTKSQISNYKILEGNEENQVTKEELQEFIDKGWISTLGDGVEKEIKHKKYLEDGKEALDHIEKYNIDFVSKNFQETIQNDNLPSGHFYNNYFRKPVDEENHLVTNGYANSWWIDIDKLEKEGKIKKNYDGSYDFEIVLEFWPQRLFYLGLVISSLTLLFCFGYLVFDWGKKNKFKNSIKG